MQGGTRLLGLGLLGLGVLIGLMCSVWSLSQPGGLGGRLFALIAAAIIVAPLLIAGVIFYRRGQQEEREAASFGSARQTLSRRRLASGEWARRIDSLSRQLSSAAGGDDRVAREAATRLSLLADGLHAGPDEAAALEVLAAERPEALRDVDAADGSFEAELARVESAVAAFTRAGAGADAASLLAAVDRLNRVYNQRQRLLSRGTLPPVPSVAELLAPRQSLGPGSVDLNTLAVGDAVSYPGRDYLIVGRLEYEDAGFGWLGYRLRAGAQAGVLLLDAGRLWLLDAATLPPDAERAAVGAQPTLDYDGRTYRLARSGQATATVSGASGRRPGVVADYRRYEAPGDIASIPYGLWAERWDEPGAAWTFWHGEVVSPNDLQAFPRARDDGQSAGGERM